MRVGAAAAAWRVGVAAGGRVGKRVAAGLLEGVWKRSVQRHVRLILPQVAELCQEAVLRVILTVPGNQHGRQDWEQTDKRER